MEYTNLAEFLKEERDKKALTQKELSKLIGISEVMISFIENGKRAGRRTLTKLAVFFDVDYLYLRSINNVDEKAIN